MLVFSSLLRLYVLRCISLILLNGPLNLTSTVLELVPFQPFSTFGPFSNFFLLSFSLLLTSPYYQSRKKRPP